MWIALKDIHKHYGKVRANDGVSFTVAEGSIHAILGENGAGKSTIMKILSGYSRKTSGTILVNGKPVDFKVPGDATQMGIGMLYQDPMDFPLLTVLDNFMLGQTAGLADQSKHFRKIFTKLSSDLNFSLDPDAAVRPLTVGERQQLEILRLLALGSKVLILDEPTTGISDLQKQTLFEALLKLAEEGKSVILVSHKLEDVEALCDRITVLREGRVTGGMEKPFDTDKVLNLMFDTPPAPPSRCNLPPGKPVLTMEKVAASGGRTGLAGCSVTICENEIVGIAGLEGSGQGVFLRLATGLKKPREGTVRLFEKDMAAENHISFQREGVTFLPTDRLEEGLISGMDITEHFALNDKSSGIFVNMKNALATAVHKIKKFRIKGTPVSHVESLSGGNQQRLLLSFLPKKPKLLLLENPTRGLDLESAHWVWEHLQKFCTRSRTSLVFTSPELDEILMVADRVLVFYDGRVIKDVKTDEIDAGELGRAIAGKC